jgi:hypothetical protein
MNPAGRIKQQAILSTIALAIEAPIRFANIWEVASLSLCPSGGAVAITSVHNLVVNLLRKHSLVISKYTEDGYKKAVFHALALSLSGATLGVVCAGVAPSFGVAALTPTQVTKLVGITA